MKTEATGTYWARIYIAGPLNEIEQSCREFVLSGLCVTVTATNYIYTGGEESGAIIELINYPRFPSTEDEIYVKARDLAIKVMEDCHQVSFTLMTPTNTIYHSRREELGVR